VSVNVRYCSLRCVSFEMSFFFVVVGFGVWCVSLCRVVSGTDAQQGQSIVILFLGSSSCRGRIQTENLDLTSHFELPLDSSITNNQNVKGEVATQFKVTRLLG